MPKERAKTCQQSDNRHDTRTEPLAKQCLKKATTVLPQQQQTIPSSGKAKELGGDGETVGVERSLAGVKHGSVRIYKQTNISKQASNNNKVIIETKPYNI